MRANRVQFSYDLNVQAELLATMRAVARHYYGPLGTFVYDAYEFVNESYYGGDLPVPALTIAITAYGSCLGLTRPRDDRQPVVCLHPSTIRSTEKNTVWGYPGHVLGLAFAYDVLLHEFMHVGVEYLIGRGTGDSSHNNDGWMAEVNRLSPLVGLPDIDAQRTIVKRVPVSGELTKTGKVPTKPAKVAGGNVSLDYISRWPHSVKLQRWPDYYANAELPFALSDPIGDIVREAM